MLLSSKAGPQDLSERGLRWWENDQLAVGWKGHLFVPGFAAGEASVAELAKTMATRNLAEVASDLAGVFGLFVFDKAARSWQVAVDNGGQYKVYYDRQDVGTSFLELLRTRPLAASELDKEALTELLAHGYIMAGRTAVSSIGKLRGNEVLELGADGRIRRTPKRLAAEQPGGTEAVLAHFAALAKSLAGRALSVDATGGFDSRLLLALLAKHGLPFELAVSGYRGTPDTEIPAQLAGLLGRPFHLSGHDLADLDRALTDAFQSSDGLMDVRRWHRDRQLAADRLARGVEVIAHGGGGELFRDHCFIQDFPRYGSSHVNIERYYRLRMYPVTIPPEYLTVAGREILAGVQAATLARFSELKAPTNNETYDSIYYFLRTPEHFGQHYANYINLGLDVVAPLLDYHNVRVALALPPWGRFFYGWHRQVITGANPVLAAMPTAEGFSASSETPRMAADAWSYGMTQLRRAGKKASQRLLGKSRFHVVGAFAADAPGFIGHLRGSAHFARALERLKAAGILDPDLAPESVRDIHVGRLITAGLLLGELEGYA